RHPGERRPCLSRAYRYFGDARRYRIARNPVDGDRAAVWPVRASGHRARVMLYRLAGIRHTSYSSARKLFPVPFDRWLLIAVLALAVAAPFYLSPLHLNSYLMPWIIWATAALGLNLLMGWAGQVHLGYAAVMAIGAYTTIHAVRAGVPFELGLVVGGLASSVIGLAFGAAAMRVKGLYLAVTTLAMQSVVDWTIV